MVNLQFGNQEQSCNISATNVLQTQGKNFGRNFENFPFTINTIIFFGTHFSLYPKEPQARARVDFLLNWDLGDLYASIMKSLYPTLGFRPMPADLEAEKKNYHAKLQFMNDHLIQVRNLDIALWPMLWAIL